jgi:large subunit ribosomal protein L4e
LQLQISGAVQLGDPSTETSSQVSATKKGYKLPRSLLTNSDLTRLINSDEIQSVVNAPKVQSVLRSYTCNAGFMATASAAGVLRPSTQTGPRVCTRMSHKLLLCAPCRRAHARTCP